MLTRRNLIHALTRTLTIGAATMAIGSDDLTDLFTAQPSGLATPMRYLQGVIQTWNPTTLENTVRVGQTTLTNLPVLGAAEAASYREGITVGIAIVNAAWAIIGRFVIPNTPDAADAITQISQRTYTATVLTQQATSSATFVDLATAGPTVTGVRIPASGKVEVTICAQFATTSGAAATLPGSVGVDVSGATTIAPDTKQSLLCIAPNPAGIQASRSVLFTGLPAGGICNFKLMYRSDGATSVDFSFRDIIVRAL